MPGVDVSRSPASGPGSLPFTARHTDPSGPLALEAAIVGWTPHGDTEGPRHFRCSLGHGQLFDIDRGPFPLLGLELVLQVSPAGGLEPGFVANPGGLSEFQQEWLLDAVCRVLNGEAADREPAS